jgi:hypothetical protein
MFNQFTKAQPAPHEHPSAKGAIAWCKRCGRKHPRREECNLELAERVAKSGRKVMRLVHPAPKTPGRKKTRARKS